MNRRIMPSDVACKSFYGNLGISSPISAVVLSLMIIGFCLFGRSLAQSQSTTAQPAISYASYSISSSGASTSSQLAVRNWALEVANAQRNLDPNRLPDVVTARRRLDQTMLELENFLATSPQHQANWLSFLTWNDLRNELKEEKPDFERLNQIEKTFRQNYFGLELRQFTNVREALVAYAHALKFGTNKPKVIEVFNSLMTKLSEKLQIPNVVQDFENTRDIGQTLAFLTQANQASDLVRAVRGSYARANARVLVSSEFVNKRFSRPVSEANPVNELILGTQLYGQSWLQGSVTPQLIDSNTHAALRLNLSGSFSSQNIGYNRSVKLHTQGFANVAASETIALTEGGLVTLNDTATDAKLASQINDIEAKLRIVRKIASKQAAKQKPEADAIAEGRLENRIRTQFHEKLSGQIAEANQRIKNPDLTVLARLGLDRPSRTTWSSPQYLALLWKLQGTTQLAAPASCPLVVDPTGITVQLHESIVTNMLDPVLAGRILRSSEMDSISAQFGGALGNRVIKQKDEKPWAITMDRFHPVEIQLDNSLVTFRIRTIKLDSGDQVLEKTASIEASYKIVLINGAIQFERQGDINIVFIEQRGARAATLRRLLRGIFDEVFKEKLLDQPIRITERLPSEFQDLYVSSIDVDDG